MKMKILNRKNQKFAVALIILMILGACTDLEVDILSELTPSNFPKTTAQFDAAKGPIYSIMPDQLRNYWSMQTYSTDDHILPARAGNWDDGGQYRTLHKHTWTVDHNQVSSLWNAGFRGITACNQVMAMFAEVPDGELKDRNFAEIRLMRAFYYSLMLDNFGNVPVMRSFEDDPPQSNRSEVFNFIETEVKEILDLLPEEVTNMNYGRPTRWMGHALLARLYINAEVYTGTAMWNKAVEQCDFVIKSGKYLLDPDFKKMFWYNNGPHVREFIFALIFNSFQTPVALWSRYTLTTELSQFKYGMGDRSQSNAHKFQPEYFDKFNLPGDVRNETVLIGPQYTQGGAPITIKTTYSRLDQDYTGPTPDRDTIWHVEFFRNIWLRGNIAQMDCANDLTSQHMGARSVKFYPDPGWNPTPRSENHDFPWYRLADIIMMKAEAILRGATPTEGDTPMSLVNQIRSRAQAPLFTANPTLDELLDERAREFQHEALRRMDLIRFGKFNDTRIFKYEASQPFRILFPIPAAQINLNPQLKQNPGYTGG
jgi:starch-binding outer membrane protein, SusD/RagB family